MRSIALAMLAAGCLMVHDSAAQVGDDQAALARDLISGDRNRVADALERLYAGPLVPSDKKGYGDVMFREGYEVTTELVETLIVALEREWRLYEEGGSPDPYLELNSGLRHAVSATRHPLAMDILLRTQWWGGSDVLLMFGPDVVLPRAVELAGSPEATPEEAREALRVLETAVERWDEVLGPEIREAMKEVAILHLEGPPDSFASAAQESGKRHWRDFLFDGAVALAKVLRDPELTAIARKARHPSSGRPGIP